MSVLIPCQESLIYRSCNEGEYFNLLDWFAWVELLVWEKVNSYFADNRPNSIFLVTGQTLSSGYAITHKESGSAECEVFLETDIGIPNILNAKSLAQYTIQRAHATLGFEEVQSRTDGDDKYSIFLDIYHSVPIRRFKLGSLKSRLEDMYR